MDIKQALFNISIIIGLACSMEFVAWITHKFVMHGILWSLHKDHHRPKGLGWQKNDLFALFFSGIAIGLFLLGSITGQLPWTSAGIGVTLYGIGYVLFHDIMFHRRIKRIRIPARSRYLKRIIKAHSVHHQTPGKTGGRAFGFLYASSKYDPARQA